MIRSEIIRELEQAVGAGNVTSDPNDLIAYSYDSQPEKGMADAMVLASSASEIAATV